MKKTLLLLSLMSIISCSSNDDSNTENQIPNPTSLKGKLKSLNSTEYGKSEYTYSSNGYVSKISHKEENGIDFSTVYNYEGNKLTSINYLENGVVKHGTNFVYSGDLITKSTSNEQEHVDQRIFTYDSYDNLAKEEYYIDGKLSQTVTFTIINGNVVRRIVNSSEGVFNTNFEYDNKNNPHSTAFTIAYLKINYEGKNNVIKENNDTYQYEYNDTNFPVKKSEEGNVTAFEYFN